MKSILQTLVTLILTIFGIWIMKWVMFVVVYIFSSNSILLKLGTAIGPSIGIAMAKSNGSYYSQQEDIGLASKLVVIILCLAGVCWAVYWLSFC